MSLTGKTVLITRGVEQSSDLRTRLEQRGARVIECPMIEIVPVVSWNEVDAAVQRLDTYHWILFTSTNAVDQFMKRVELAGATCKVPIAAVGAATAARLKGWNLGVSLVPDDFRAEGLLEKFPRDLSGSRILFPRAEVARELLPRELRQRGAAVDVITVYRTVKSEAARKNFTEILAGQKVDCVVFTSSSTVRHFVETLGDEVKTLLAGSAVAVMGPITRETAEAAGLRPTIEPSRSTIADLVDALSVHLE